MNDTTPLIVVVGTTASGKSALGMLLAEKFGGQILCADSRTIYRGMDIGTAKPSVEDMQQIQHYGVDIATPDQRFSAAQYKQYALDVLNTMYAIGALPIIVGGTGLYVDALLYDYHFRAPGNPMDRDRLSALSVEELQAELRQRCIALPANARNPRHLIRAIETEGANAERRPLRQNTLIIGLNPPPEVLEQRIRLRLDMMLAKGLETEVRQLARRYSWEVPALQTIGYREFRGYIDGSGSLDQAKEAIVANTLHYAKRQRTWFKRNKSIHWFDGDNLQRVAVDLVTTFLNK